MTLWNIGPVSLEPEVSITRWRVFEVDGGAKHFVGADERNFSGRVSSEIVAFDCEARRGRTVSGRVYQLIGSPGRTDDADYVWRNWCIVNGVKSFIDVTRQVVPGSVAERDNGAQQEAQPP